VEKMMGGSWLSEKGEEFFVLLEKFKDYWEDV